MVEAKSKMAGLEAPAAIFAETSDFMEFKKRVKQKTGIDLNLYKQQQMHRRLLNLHERVQVTNFTNYYAVLESRAGEWKVFLDRMTINVSELFRNPEKWEELRRPILTEWFANAGSASRQSRSYKIWSAGCSYGAEPYSLALLLDQIAPNARHTLHATDLDRTILAKAREGCFSSADVRNVSPALLERYFTRLTPGVALSIAARDLTLPDGSPDSDVPHTRTIHSFDMAYQLRDEIRSRITFKQHNLLADRFEDGYDLICCRNVVIYFTDDAKQALFQCFHNALKPGGILFVGGTERIFDSRALGFDMPIPFFYRKIS